MQTRTNIWQASYADSDAYKAHYSSLQRIIELQGGWNQTRTHAIVKAFMAGGEISLAHHRYMATEQQTTASKKDCSPPQFPLQTPFKLKFPMPPFAPEIMCTIDRMSSGFQSLAKASKLSVQALQLLHLACKWSLIIDQPPKSDAEEKQLLANTAGANVRLTNLYDESIQTKRIAALLLISLPADAGHMRLERTLCLAFLNLLHSVTLRPHPIPLRDRIVVDFAESIFSFYPKDCNEEDCMVWLALAVASEWRHCAAKMKASPLLALHGYNSVILCQMWIQKSRQVVDWIIVKCDRARTWEEITAICSRFLWLRRLGPEWKATWEEAMERRLRNLPRKKT